MLVIWTVSLTTKLLAGSEYLDLIFLKCKVRRHMGSLSNDEGNSNEHS